MARRFCNRACAADTAILLPGMGPVDEHKLFFVVADQQPAGAEVIDERILRQLGATRIPIERVHRRRFARFLPPMSRETNESMGTLAEHAAAEVRDQINSRLLTGGNLAMVRKKILVVDDDPDVRLGLQLRLNANHYDVICAADGVASIAEARKHMPDLVILDLGLPAGDGFSVLERLKANEKLSSIPVIVLSGRDRVGNRDRAIKAGAKAFLQKPMPNDKLLAVIRLALEAENHTPPVVYDLAESG